MRKLTAGSLAAILAALVPLAIFFTALFGATAEVQPVFTEAYRLDMGPCDFNFGFMSEVLGIAFGTCLLFLGLSERFGDLQ